MTAGRAALLAALALSVAVNAAAAFAYFGARSRLDAAREGRAVERLLVAEVGLTAAEMEAFGELRAAVRGEIAAARGEAARLNDAFWAELAGDAPDAARLGALVDARAEQVRAFNRSAASRLAAFVAGLDPAVRARLAGAVRPLRLLGGRFLMSGPG